MQIDLSDLADLDVPIGLHGLETDVETGGPPCIVLAIILILYSQDAH